MEIETLQLTTKKSRHVKKVIHNTQGLHQIAKDIIPIQKEREATSLTEVALKSV